MIRVKTVSFLNRKDGRTAEDILNEFLAEREDVIAVQEIEKLFANRDDCLNGKICGVVYLITYKV